MEGADVLDGANCPSLSSQTMSSPALRFSVVSKDSRGAFVSVRIEGRGCFAAHVFSCEEDVLLELLLLAELGRRQTPGGLTFEFSPYPYREWTP